MALEWRIVQQQEMDRLTPQGSFEPIVKVTYALASGTQGMVEVPKRLYNAEYVRDQVAKAAETKYAIENMSQ